MRYLPETTNVYFFHDDLDSEMQLMPNVRFASYGSTFVPEKGERITGTFGYWGAEVTARVVSCEPSGDPVGICYDVHLRQVDDGKCLWCRAEDGSEHNRLVDSLDTYPCPALDKAN